MLLTILKLTEVIFRFSDRHSYSSCVIKMGQKSRDPAQQRKKIEAETVSAQFGLRHCLLDRHWETNGVSTQQSGNRSQLSFSGRRKPDTIFFFNFFKKPEKSGKMKKRLKTHQFDLASTHVDSSSGTPEAETKKRKLGELRKFFTKICVNYK